jgi:hypothetical protein
MALITTSEGHSAGIHNHKASDGVILIDSTARRVLCFSPGEPHENHRENTKVFEIWTRVNDGPKETISYCQVCGNIYLWEKGT